MKCGDNTGEISHKIRQRRNERVAGIIINSREVEQEGYEDTMEMIKVNELYK